MTTLGTKICRLGDHFVAALGLIEGTAEYQRIERLNYTHEHYLQFISL
jgi:hypothetical protein